MRRAVYSICWIRVDGCESFVEVRTILEDYRNNSSVELLRLNKRVGSASCKVAVPSVRSADDAASRLVYPVLNFLVVSVMEADKAIGVNRRGNLRAFAETRIKRLRHFNRAVFANDFAVDVVAKFAIYENFIVNANAVFGAEQHICGSAR